jgi:hypothetical protein
MKTGETGGRRAAGLCCLAALLLATGCGPGRADAPVGGAASSDAGATATAVAGRPAGQAATPSPGEGQAGPAATPQPEDDMQGAEDEVRQAEGYVQGAEGFSYEPVPEAIRARMRGASYPEGCPVPWEELRYARVRYRGFDGQDHEGELVVNRRIASEALSAFQELYEAGYPIERIRLIDDYGADDEASMADNNSSCFCYRPIAGSNRLSYHAQGLAIDINPLYNPAVAAGSIQPAAGAPYANDRDASPYCIDQDDLCYDIMTRHGFSWGGAWRSKKDYQHFEWTEDTP